MIPDFISASSLPKQLTIAEKEVAEAEQHMNHIKISTSREERAKWEAQLDKALSERKGHNCSMDIMLVQTPPGSSSGRYTLFANLLSLSTVVPMQAVKAQLINKETKTPKARQGVAGWVASAIEIQFSQYVCLLLNVDVQLIQCPSP